MLESRVYRSSTFVPVLLALGLGASGCNQPKTTENPTISALVSTGDSLDATDTQSASTSGTATPAVHLRDLAEDCDPSPVVTTADVCGGPMVASVASQWTNCTVDACPGASPSQTPVTSSGTLDVTTEVPSSPTCPTDPLHPYDHVATFSIERVHSDGRTVKVDGTTTRSLESIDLTGTVSKHVAIDVTRTVDRSGAETRQVHVTGELDITDTGVDLDRRRTIGGTLRIDGTRGSGQHPIAASLTLRGVVRAPRAVCFWPLAGTIVRDDDDGTSETTTFGPDCGMATRDGVQVDLSR